MLLGVVDLEVVLCMTNLVPGLTINTLTDSSSFPSFFVFPIFTTSFFSDFRINTCYYLLY